MVLPVEPEMFPVGVTVFAPMPCAKAFEFDELTPTIVLSLKSGTLKFPPPGLPYVVPIIANKAA